MTRSREKDYFDYLSGRSWVGLAYRRLWLYPRLCRHLQGRVLDIGCGIGDMLRHRPGTIGIDVNSHAVASCQSNGLDARIMQPDCLPFPEGDFDGVILDNVLEHLSAPEGLLAETRRVLKRGGTLIVGVPGRRGYASDADHQRFYDADGLRSLLRQSGFDCDRIIRMPLPVPALDRYLRQYCVYGVFRRE